MEIPMTRLCRILGVPRSMVYHQPKVERLHRPVDEALAQTIHGIIQAHPTYGIRRVWAWLKHRLDQPANRKRSIASCRSRAGPCASGPLGSARECLDPVP